MPIWSVSKRYRKCRRKWRKRHPVYLFLKKCIGSFAFLVFLHLGKQWLLITGLSGAWVKDTGSAEQSGERGTFLSFLKTKVHWQFCKVQHLWGTGEVSGSPRWSRVLHRSWPSASWSPTRQSRPSAPPLRTYTIIIRDIVRTIRGGGFLLL